MQSVQDQRAGYDKVREAHFNNDIGRPETRLGLLIQLNNAAVLPLANDALRIETFVDDAGTDLTLATRESTYNQSSRAVQSKDGSTIFVSVNAQASLSPDAERLYAKGGVFANAGFGEPTDALVALPNNLGDRVTEGPFQITLTSKDELEGGAVRYRLDVRGDLDTVRNISVVDNNDESAHNGGIGYSDRGGVRRVMFTARPGVGPIKLQLSYYDAVRPVYIPFEAQVDVGYTAGGLLAEAEQRADPARYAGQVPERKTPVMPDRRAKFTPGDGAATGVETMDGATVDLFSITISKPTSEESPGVFWQTQPENDVWADGYVLPRLLVSMKDGGILAIAEDGIKITKFTDNRGGNLDQPFDQTTTATIFQPYGNTDLSESGYQALAAVAIPASPTPGSTKLTIGGTVKANVTVGEKVETSEQIVTLRPDTKFTVGDLDGTVTALQPRLGTEPPRFVQSQSVTLTLAGPIGFVRQLELLDAESDQLVGRYSLRYSGREDFRATPNARTTFSVPLFGQFNGNQVKVRITHFEKVESVDIPFEFTTGIGL